MLTTAEATAAISASVRPLQTERVALADANGRTLRQPVVAERDQPPFDRVMMDGIALAFSEFASGTREFELQAMQAAGDPALVLQPGKAIEIMTGAALPAGADCIVPVERIQVHAGRAVIEADYPAKERQFIHPRGSDHPAGTRLLATGTRIGPLELAVVASAGLAEVEVSAAPRITVISTGNELVPAGNPIEEHQVRLSNGPAIMAMLEPVTGADVRHAHLPDDEAILSRAIAEHLCASKVLVLSGGVSMGKADFIPGVLQSLGVEPVFHRISQRPGKPMWFGMGRDDQAVFALPGNPVSSLVCCRHYVLPALRQMAGLPALPPQFASLTQDVHFEPALTCFLPARAICNAAAQTLAMPVHSNTSGDFASLAGTSGYIELARERSDFAAGSVLPWHPWQLRE